MGTLSERPSGYLFDHTIMTLPGGTQYEACALANQPRMEDAPELMSGVIYTIPVPVAADFYIIDIDYDSYLTAYACIQISTLKALKLKLEVGLVFTREANPLQQTV